MEMKELHDGTLSASIEYLFNEDGLSKNDKSHIIVGSALISPYGRLIEKQLKETHRGVSATREFRTKYFEWTFFQILVLIFIPFG